MAASDTETIKRNWQLCLIGHPVAHSLSPQMHRAALAHFQLEGDYVAIDISPRGLKESLPELSARFAGFNVTVPHKQALFDLVHERTPVASRCGAVNTVKVETGNKLIGHNTDVGGFLCALGHYYGKDLGTVHATIIGAGGAARAALVALVQAGAASVTLVARDQNKASQLIEQLTKTYDQDRVNVPIQVLQLTTRLPGVDLDSAGRQNLLINCTPIGLVDKSIPDWMTLEMQAASGAFFFDMVYSRQGETALLAAARQVGLRGADGKEMLVEQAALAFEFWTGLHPPSDIMKDAIA